MHTRAQLLAVYAHQNRTAPTESEAKLWRALRACQLGVRFRRQVPPLGKYVVDFLAPEVKLVVEVDGGYHAGRAAADARGDEDLRRAGYRVLRLKCGGGDARVGCGGAAGAFGTQVSGLTEFRGVDPVHRA